MNQNYAYLYWKKLIKHTQKGKTKNYVGLKVDCNKKQNFEVHKKLHFEQKTKSKSRKRE